VTAKAVSETVEYVTKKFAKETAEEGLEVVTKKIEAFIASGCETPRDACPATKADVELADALALIVALEGMSTTFLPIACP